MHIFLFDSRFNKHKAGNAVFINISGLKQRGRWGERRPVDDTLRTDRAGRRDLETTGFKGLVCTAVKRNDPDIVWVISFYSSAEDGT